MEPKIKINRNSKILIKTYLKQRPTINKYSDINKSYDLHRVYSKPNLKISHKISALNLSNINIKPLLPITSKHKKTKSSLIFSHKQLNKSCIENPEINLFLKEYPQQLESLEFAINESEAKENKDEIIKNLYNENENLTKGIVKLNQFIHEFEFKTRQFTESPKIEPLIKLENFSAPLSLYKLQYEKLVARIEKIKNPDYISELEQNILKLNKNIEKCRNFLINYKSSKKNIVFFIFTL